MIFRKCIEGLLDNHTIEKNRKTHTYSTPRAQALLCEQWCKNMYTTLKGTLFRTSQQLTVSVSVTTQVDKEGTKSVHSIPLLKWVFYHWSVHSFYTFSHHSITAQSMQFVCSIHCR